MPRRTWLPAAIFEQSDHSKPEVAPLARRNLASEDELEACKLVFLNVDHDEVEAKTAAELRIAADNVLTLSIVLLG
jgi:hypothetical protein